jgi:hypothetical protein
MQEDSSKGLVWVPQDMASFARMKMGCFVNASYHYPQLRPMSSDLLHSWIKA